MITTIFQTITAKMILPILLIFVICPMINAQNTKKTLLIDETAEVAGKIAVQVGEISDTLNRLAVETALREAQQKLELSPQNIANAKIYDVAEVNGVEMFEGIKGQHIRHITIEYSIYLYSLGNYQGLIAIRGNKILAHYVYFAKDDRNLKILDDINHNGKIELMIQSERIDSRGYFRSIRIVELSESGIEQIFFCNTYDNPTDVPAIYLKTIGSKIYVEKSKTLLFYEEEFERSGDGWKKTKELSKITDYSTNIIDYIEVSKPILFKSNS